MRIAIVGAGAMGTLLGHGFCKGGHEVSIVDLPDRVDQLRATGKLIVIGTDGSESSALPSVITSDYLEAGIHEVVILATKSQHLPAVAQGIGHLIDESSMIISIQNGIPWWYLRGLPHPHGDKRIHCLDPDGSLERLIPTSQVVGCVAYPAAMMEEDGRARHVEGRNFPVGELDGVARERTSKVAGLFMDAGFKSRIIDDIRSEIWLKAWGALSINPISALTRATMRDICTFTATRELVAQMMREAQAVAESYGATFRHTIEKRIEGARAVGPHKTSMLQDVENGRSLELDGLMLAVLELAELAGKRVPTIQAVYACAALLNSTLLEDQSNISMRAL